MHWYVSLAGTPVNAGGMVSWTVMVWPALMVLVQASVAVQVHVMIKGQIPLVVQLRVTVTLVSQLSVAVTAGGGGISPRHW
jgi:hypothetical protein